MKKSDIRLNMTTLQGIGARSGQQDGDGFYLGSQKQLFKIEKKES